MKTTLASIIAASVFALFVQASYADVETYHAHGVVESVDTTNKTLTLKQDAVTELGWPVRTMNYSIDGNNIMTNVKTGENIDVTFTDDSPYHPVIHSIN